ncbi:MAG: HEAT repeat domain-containing protein, partial [Alphaproteobacteria bacterium]|nr:HEAT repeat domain-containing protein [Alphaproteobacteria bacterium]
MMVASTGRQLQLTLAILAAFVLLLLVPSRPAWPQARTAAFEAQAANLTNPRSATRIAAIQAMTQLEDDEEVVVAVTLIVERLRDEDPAVRVAAVRELGRLGELAAAAIPDIGLALADGDFAVSEVEGGGIGFRSVAMAAAAALADLGPAASAALPNLLATLKAKDPRLRAAAAKAIGYMGPAASAAVPGLVSALSDPSPETRFEAAFALGQAGSLPPMAVAALRRSLSDTGRHVEALPSGAEVIGSVRVAAGEALLNLADSHIADIRRHGGDIRESDEEEPELPWLAGRRLRLSADENDVRDVIAIVLRANQMTVSFRRDVEGFVTFDFLGMPVQGAFNMLLHEYNLSYEWDERRRHVSIVPYRSVYFPSAAPVVAAATPPRPQARPPKTKVASSRKAAAGAAKPGTGATAKVVVAAKKAPLRKSAAQPPKAVPPRKTVVIAAKPKPKAKITAKAATKIKAETKSKPAPRTAPAKQTGSIVRAAAPSPVKKKAATAAKVETVPAAKSITIVKVPAGKAGLSAPEKPPATAAVKRPPRKPAKRLAARPPAAASTGTKPPEPTDISKEHKLSFIIKYDGLYRAMIDGHEYTAGMSIITVQGEMVIADIRKRAVHLLQKSGNG